MVVNSAFPRLAEAAITSLNRCTSWCRSSSFSSTVISDHGLGIGFAPWLGFPDPQGSEGRGGGHTPPLQPSTCAYFLPVASSIASHRARNRPKALGLRRSLTSRSVSQPLPFDADQRAGRAVE